MEKGTSGLISSRRSGSNGEEHEGLDLCAILPTRETEVAMIWGPEHLKVTTHKLPYWHQLSGRRCKLGPWMSSDLRVRRVRLRAWKIRLKAVTAS